MTRTTISRRDGDFAAALLAAGRSERPHPTARRRAIAAMAGLGAASLGAASLGAASVGAATTETATTAAGGAVADALAPSFFKVAASPFAIAAAKIAVVGAIVLAPAPPAGIPSSTTADEARVESRAPASTAARRDTASTDASSGAGPSNDVPASGAVRSAEPVARPVARVPDERAVGALPSSPASRANPARATASDALPSSASTSAVEPPPPAGRDDALLVEVARLEEARRALDAGNFDAASKIVGTDAVSSSSVLAAEREVMAIEVLVREGNLDVARARAATFATRFGEGRLASRVARLVAPR